MLSVPLGTGVLAVLQLGAFPTCRLRRDCPARLPFNLGWRAFTFPLGVLTAAAFKLGHLSTFGVLGNGLTLILLWPCYAGWQSGKGIYRRSIQHR